MGKGGFFWYKSPYTIEESAHRLVGGRSLRSQSLSANKIFQNGIYSLTSIHILFNSLWWMKSQCKVVSTLKILKTTLLTDLTEMYFNTLN